MNYKISYLLSEYPKSYVKKEQAIRLTGLSESEITQQLNKIFSFFELSKKKGSDLFVPMLTPERWTRIQVSEKNLQVIYSEEERRELIYLLSYSKFELLSLFHFQDFLEVSKGTVIADIKKLRKFLKKEEIILDYSRKTGFVLQGDETVIRKIAKNCIARLLQSTSGKFGLFLWLNQHELSRYARIRDALETAAQKTGLDIVPSRIDELIFFIGYSEQRIRGQLMTEAEEKSLIQSLVAYQTAELFFETIGVETSDSEKVYLTMVMMSLAQGEIQDISLDILLKCSSEIIHRMEQLSAIEFADFKELLMNLFYHLVPAYFRIKNEFYLPNVLIDNIQSDYPDIFDLTMEALTPLEEIVHKKIPREEVGFFTILFGGAIANQNQKEEKIEEIQAVIVCPSGISSSLILQTELKKLFPTIIFREANSVDQLQSISEESYDVIFSTIPLEMDKRVYLVKPLMSQLEKNQLVNIVQGELLVPGLSLPSAKEIIDALKPYIDLKNGVTEEKLYKVLNKKMNHFIEQKEDNRPMLTELITPEMIQLTDEQLQWEEAIKLAAKPLVDGDYVEPRYVDAMIDKVKQYGPFIHIGKGIALPHARPEDGVNKVGMSLLKVEKPVLLMDDEKHAIRIFVCLAAVDNEAHLRALASLTKLLSNSENLEALLAASTKEEIINILEKGEN